MKKLQKYLNTVQFKTLSGYVFGILILFGGILIWNVFHNNPAPDYYIGFLASIASLCVAISSVFVIKYKEAPRPGLNSIKGTWAVIQGFISLLLFGTAFIVLLYDATVRILK